MWRAPGVPGTVGFGPVRASPTAVMAGSGPAGGSVHPIVARNTTASAASSQAREHFMEPPISRAARANVWTKPRARIAIEPVNAGGPWWSGVVRTDEPSLTARGVALARSRFDRPATATGDPAGDVALARSLLADAPDELLTEGAPDAQLTAVLAETPCDVALLVSRDATPEGPVLVPFGGAEHDWAAVELGAWFARADHASPQLAGAAAVPEHGRRDASRLLSHGALAVQRVLGISAEPLLTPPGDEGMLEASRDAGLLVVGLSTRWHREGLGPARLRLAREAIPPTLLVRRGLRPGGLAPPTALTRFTWSIRS